MWKRIPLLILAFTGVMAEISFPTGILVPLTVFFTLSAPAERGLWIAVGGGLLSDAFFQGPFGGHTIALLSVFAVTQALVRRWLTSQSFYALLGLSAAGTVVSQAVIYSYAGLASITNPNAALNFSVLGAGMRLMVNSLEVLGMVAIAAVIRAPIARIFMPRTR